MTRKRIAGAWRRRATSALLALTLVGALIPAYADAKVNANHRLPQSPGHLRPALAGNEPPAAANALRREVEELVRVAMPRVQNAVGHAWEPVAVVVSSESPDPEASFARDAGVTGDVSQIAAVTTADSPPRVVINPSVFARLSPLGRQVVVAHELSHAATHDITGSSTPAWHAEGFADLVAYRGVQQPLAVSAQELRARVRSGQLPTSLPADQAFRAGSQAVAEAYQSAWFAVALLQRHYGDAGLLAFYREVGRSQGAGREGAVERALRRRGTSLRQFTAEWQASVSDRLDR